MARAGPPLANGRHPPPGGVGPNRTDRYRLLRNSHIFASAVQDVLQVDFLRRVSPDPITPAQLQLLRLMARPADAVKPAPGVYSIQVFTDEEPVPDVGARIAGSALHLDLERGQGGAAAVDSSTKSSV